MTVEENSEWVKIRAACSVAKVFAELESAVKADIEQRNAIREGEQVRFRVEPDSAGGFSATREGVAHAPTVKFTCDESSIHVHGSNLNLRATLTLNAEGDCRIVVNGHELKGWQFRRMALESLFFDFGPHQKSAVTSWKNKPEED